MPSSRSRSSRASSTAGEPSQSKPPVVHLPAEPETTEAARTRSTIRKPSKASARKRLDHALPVASHLQVRVLRAELPPILEADLSVSVSCPMPSDHESDDGDGIDPALPASQLFDQATFALLGCTGGRESRAG